MILFAFWFIKIKNANYTADVLVLGKMKGEM